MKLVDIFPSKPCGRCGGSGRYSYNTMDGDRCYGCGGSGIVWATKAITAAVNAYTQAVKGAKERIASQLTVGTEVLNTFGFRKDKGDTWVTITAIEVTDEECGWSKTGDTKVTYYYHNVTLADGSVRKVNSNQVVRTRSYGVDLTPFAAGVGITYTKESKP